MTVKEEINCEIKKDINGCPFLFIEVKKNDNVVFKINEFEVDENTDNYLSILETMIECIEDNKEEYKSGSISDRKMINKYGQDFLNRMKEYDFSDFDYFNCSLFIKGESDSLPIIIVPTNKHIYIIKGDQSVSVKLTENTLNDLKILMKYFSVFGDETDGVYESDLVLKTM